MLSTTATSTNKFSPRDKAVSSVGSSGKRPVAGSGTVGSKATMKGVSFTDFLTPRKNADGGGGGGKLGGGGRFRDGGVVDGDKESILQRVKEAHPDYSAWTTELIAYQTIQANEAKEEEKRVRYVKEQHRRAELRANQITKLLDVPELTDVDGNLQSVTKSRVWLAQNSPGALSHYEEILSRAMQLEQHRRRGHADVIASDKEEGLRVELEERDRVVASNVVSQRIQKRSKYGHDPWSPKAAQKREDVAKASIVQRKEVLASSMSAMRSHNDRALQALSARSNDVKQTQDHREEQARRTLERVRHEDDEREEAIRSGIERKVAHVAYYYQMEEEFRFTAASQRQASMIVVSETVERGRIEKAGLTYLTYLVKESHTIYRKQSVNDWATYVTALKRTERDEKATVRLLAIDMEDSEIRRQLSERQKERSNLAQTRYDEVQGERLARIRDVNELKGEKSQMALLTSKERRSPIGRRRGDGDTQLLSPTSLSGDGDAESEVGGGWKGAIGGGEEEDRRSHCHPRGGSIGTTTNTTATLHPSQPPQPRRPTLPSPRDGVRGGAPLPLSPRGLSERILNGPLDSSTFSPSPRRMTAIAAASASKNASTRIPRYDDIRASARVRSFPRATPFNEFITRGDRVPAPPSSSPRKKPTPASPTSPRTKTDRRLSDSDSMVSPNTASSSDQPATFIRLRDPSDRLQWEGVKEGKIRLAGKRRQQELEERAQNEAQKEELRAEVRQRRHEQDHKRWTRVVGSVRHRQSAIRQHTEDHEKTKMDILERAHERRLDANKRRLENELAQEEARDLRNAIVVSPPHSHHHPSRPGYLSADKEKDRAMIDAIWGSPSAEPTPNKHHPDSSSPLSAPPPTMRYLQHTASSREAIEPSNPSPLMASEDINELSLSLRNDALHAIQEKAKVHNYKIDETRSAWRQQLLEDADTNTFNVSRKRVEAASSRREEELNRKAAKGAAMSSPISSTAKASSSSSRR